MSVNRHCNFTRQKCDHERRRENLKHKNIAIAIEHMWNIKTEVVSIIIGSWNHLKIIQKISEQHTLTARYQGTTDNSHIGHCTHTAESTDVKYKIFNMGNSITCTTYCKHRITITLYTLELLFQAHNCKYDI
jgi:hypothetical protein